MFKQLFNDMRDNYINTTIIINGVFHERISDFVPPVLKFTFYLLFLVPSIICAVLVLYYILSCRVFLRALNNHVLILLLIISLICQLTIYPWMLYFYYRQTPWPRSLSFCKIWGFIDWGLYVTQIILVAWTSIERHILVFHDKWILTKRRRFFIHYLPLAILPTYCCIFYFIVYFIPPCQNEVIISRTSCLDACLYANFIFNMWETIVHQILPNLIIVTFSLALLVRVVWHKHRMHQTIRWRKHRKLSIQLFSITLLYLIFSFPNTFLVFLYLCGFDYDQNDGFKKCAEFFSYFTILFIPFVCLFALPELRTRFKRFLQRRQRRRIANQILFTTTLRH